MYPWASSACPLQVRQQCKELAQTLLKKKHLFVLGKGYGEPVAYEVSRPRLSAARPLLLTPRGGIRSSIASTYEPE